MFGSSIAINIFRAKLGKTFRKKIGVYDYKIGHKTLHKRPGMMDVRLKQRLIKEDTQEGRNRIKMAEINSPRNYGKVGNKGQFIMDKSKLPFYDIPDLTDFKLKPFVSYHTPKLSEEIKERIVKMNDFKDETNFGRYLSNSVKVVVNEEKKDDKV